MKKILMSLSSIAAIALVVTAASGAFFTDTATSTVSTLTSGTLALDVNDNGSASTFAWDLGDITLAPGEETDWVSITIKNGGSIPLAWYGHFNIGGPNGALMSKAIYVKDAKMEFLKEDGTTWAIAGYGEDDGTGNIVDHFITDGRGSGLYPGYFNTIADTDPFHVISLDTWNHALNVWNHGAGINTIGALNPTYSYRFSFKLGMVGEAGNAYQGKTMKLSYKVDATQINASAIAALFASNPIYVGDGSNNLGWLNDQIALQP